MVVHSAAAPAGTNVHSGGGGGGSGGGGGGLESFTATNAGGGGPGSAMVINMPSGSAAGGRLAGGGSTRYHSGGNYREPVTAPIRMLSTDLIKTYKHINEVRSLAEVLRDFFSSSVEC